MVGIYADCNLADRSFRARAKKVIDISFNRLIDAIRVVPQVKQFELRIAKRPGLPSEIASALWQKGVHMQAFSAQLQEGQDFTGRCCSHCTLGITAPHLESTVAALAFNCLAQDTVEKHICAETGHDRQI